MNLRTWAKPIQHYARWIEKQNLDAAQNWSRRLNSSDDGSVEGAVAEATMWDFLDNRELRLDLADIPGVGGPDFRCKAGDCSFFVEVTNISRATATIRTNLEENHRGHRYYALLTGQIKHEIMAKAGQLPDMAAPLLVAVTTLHTDATRSCIQRCHVENLLHSDPGISWDWNPTTGDGTGELSQSTNMRLSLFTHARSITTSRRHISGVLACGFGMRPPQPEVLGVLHPNPLHPFSPGVLLGVPFCSFAQWPPSGQIRVQWSDQQTGLR